MKNPSGGSGAPKFDMIAAPTAAIIIHVKSTHITHTIAISLESTILSPFSRSGGSMEILVFLIDAHE